MGLTRNGSDQRLDPMYILLGNFQKKKKRKHLRLVATETAIRK